MIGEQDEIRVNNILYLIDKLSAVNYTCANLKISKREDIKRKKLIENFFIGKKFKLFYLGFLIT